MGFQSGVVGVLTRGLICTRAPQLSVSCPLYISCHCPQAVPNSPGLPLPPVFAGVLPLPRQAFLRYLQGSPCLPCVTLQYGPLGTLFNVPNLCPNYWSLTWLYVFSICLPPLNMQDNPSITFCSFLSPPGPHQNVTCKKTGVSVKFTLPASRRCL